MQEIRRCSQPDSIGGFPDPIGAEQLPHFALLAACALDVANRLVIIAKVVEIHVGVEWRKSPAQVEPPKFFSGIRFVVEDTGFDLRGPVQSGSDERAAAGWARLDQSMSHTCGV